MFLLPLPLPLALVTFILGLLTTPLLIPLLERIVAKLASLCLNSRSSKRESEDDAVKEEHGLYSLDHGVLNLPSLTPDEMWMNMGYWKNTTSFPAACRALLDKILHTAGLDVDSTDIAIDISCPVASASATGVDYPSVTHSWPTDRPQRGKGNNDKTTAIHGKKRVILDVGFGCGEQTLYLMRKKVAAGKVVGGGEADGADGRDDDDYDKNDDAENISNNNKTLAGSDVGDSPESSPLFQHYIGITIEKMQCGFAQSRVAEAARNCNGSTGKLEPLKKGDKRKKQSIDGVVELFCADAAKPYGWSEEIQRSISTAFGKGKYAEERYVLGLDTLYHFSPSRKELFEYSHSTLQATLLAFDLFLPPKSRSSLVLDSVKRSLNTLALRCLTPALSAPFSNFVTIAEYKNLLEKAGYGLEDITIEDITDDVFPGLAKFFEKRIQEMSALGLKGFTKWRISGWLFRWLAGGQVLRAGVVVARWKGSPRNRMDRNDSPGLQVQNRTIQSC
ncbi:hypothetical protein GX50_08074 [[Emmonsia] crescens]|uniref:Uncharacterized protein n=1 Tax=[Emmonsia] crescens TaxID=73230 RepID=A0A2B7Z7R6_9EURO|nr:hypothetical protein GX50_08074 [Emmonsia crescens]